MKLFGLARKLDGIATKLGDFTRMFDGVAKMHGSRENA